LIERKDKPETLPLGIDKPLLLNKILKKNQFAQGTVYVRPAAVFEGSHVWNPA
jgi:hypothetical protein